LSDFQLVINRKAPLLGGAFFVFLGFEGFVILSKAKNLILHDYNRNY